MAKTISVLVDCCTIQINLDPFFGTAPLPNIYKLFKYLFQQPWRNEDTIFFLINYIDRKIAETKTAAEKPGADKKAQRLAERWVKIADAFDKKAMKYSLCTRLNTE